jgi:hypothetical protein
LFPFISCPYGDPESDLLALLTNLIGTSGPGTGWISSQEGPLWLAAVLEVKAFQCLSVQAVVVPKFNPYISLGIFVKMVASIPASPSGAPLKKKAFVYVELGIVSLVDFHAGIMSMTAGILEYSAVEELGMHEVDV